MFAPDPQNQPTPTALPFDAEFQRKLIRLVLDDDSFCTICLKYVTPPMFETDAMRWCWSTVMSERKQRRTPTVLTLRDIANKTDGLVRDRYLAMVEMLDREVIREDRYIRFALEDWVKQNIFVAAWETAQRVYSTGKRADAIELMRKESDRIHKITFNSPERYWFYEDFEDRQRRRTANALREWETTFPTGIDGVDRVLDGGLSLGEFGAWMADAKGGKSMFLVHLAAFTARALHQRVVLYLLEGSYLQTASRIDAWHANLAYREVKRGYYTAEAYQRIQEEYRQSKQRLVIRPMVDNWSYSAGDIRSDLDDLKANHGWAPVMLVVDYADLLRSQNTHVRSEEEHQKDAYGDLKSLATQDSGYAIWSATQARRPERKREEKSKSEVTYKFGKPVITRRDISESYNKVRRVDFLGSINQDEEEADAKRARLYCELYRDSPADRLVNIRQDLDTMHFVDLLDPLTLGDRAEAHAPAQPTGFTPPPNEASLLPEVT